MDKMIQIGTATIIVLLFAPLFVCAYPLTEIYPEDLSFRSGKVYRITHYENDDGTLRPTKQENFIWNSKYPFKNPTYINANWNDFDEHNVGFHAEITRYPTILNRGLTPGFVSYTLALVPFLEAKETIIFDSESTSVYRTYGEMSKFDKYGNPLITYKLGYTGMSKPIGDGWGSTFNKGYKTYTVRNPLYWDGSGALTVNSINTNLQGTYDTYFTENYPLDTRIKQNTYLYQEDPITDYIYNPLKSHAMFGWTNLPTLSIYTDAFNRTLSNVRTEYVTDLSEFEPCSISGHTTNSNCYEHNEGYRCVRLSPSSITSRGTLGDGYYERDYSYGMTSYEEIETGDMSLGKFEATAQKLSTTFDDCGNIVKLSLTGKYKDPYNEIDPMDEDLEMLTKHSTTITSNYLGSKIRPYDITTIGPPDNILSATFYHDNLVKTATNPRDITATYDYDALGRITSVTVPPDSTPTMKYTYSSYYASFGYGIRIKEEKKIREGEYSQTYHFYDGMGRLAGSQSYDDNGTIELDDDSVVEIAKVYDVYGRVIKEYRPHLIDKEYFGDFDTIYLEMDYDTTYLSYEYDSQGRVTRILDSADETEITKDYGIDAFTKYDFISVTDEKDNTQTAYSTPKGDVVRLAVPEP